MSIRRVASVASWAFLVFAAMFVGGLYPFSSLPAQGQVDGVSGSITITASPITDLVDGSVVNVHVEAKDTQIYSLTAHTCMPGKVTGDHAFDFAGPFCPNVPIGSGDLAAQVALPGATSADLAVKVGAGHVDWHNGLGFPYSITCGPGTPCDLVIRAEITNSTAYYQIPLCYGSGCPAAAPVPVGATAQQVTSAPTPTTAPPPTTTTAAPPAAAPAEGGGGPKAGTAAGGTSAKATGSGSSRSSSSGELASAASASALSVPAGASSRGWRVFVAAAAGAVGAAWISHVVARERRKRGTTLGTA